MKDHRVSRRALLAGSVAAGALGLAGVPARADQVQWKKYAGTKLEVILAKGPRGDSGVVTNSARLAPSAVSLATSVGRQLSVVARNDVRLARSGGAPSLRQPSIARK